MSVMHRLAAHIKDLGGGFMVRRSLPAAQRQAVGPFIFFDHFGPVVLPADSNTDVRPHPHIGLSTGTYLLDGAMMHRDSLGCVQRIEPGAINWMTAGRGIVHSERTPEELRGKARPIHGLQLWCALPREHEETDPAFVHTPADALPQVDLPGARCRVLVGSAFGATSPVRAWSPTIYLDIALAAGADIRLDDVAEERAIYSVEGDLDIDGEPVVALQMAVLEPGKAVRVRADCAARFVVIGGSPLDGQRFIHWNFVSSSRERVETARADWAAQRFASVPGETDFIPLP